MKQIAALMVLSMVTAGPAATLVYGSGHGRGGGGHAAGAGHFSAGHASGIAVARGARDVVRAGPPVPRPVFRGRVAVVAAPVVVGGAYYYSGGYGYPYYDSSYYGNPYAYYPPDYSAYAPPPTYIEQAPEVRYYCADLRDYYPNVPSCPSPWMKVLPNDSGGYPR